MTRNTVKIESKGKLEAELLSSGKIVEPTFQAGTVNGQPFIAKQFISARRDTKNGGWLRTNKVSIQISIDGKFFCSALTYRDAMSRLAHRRIS